MKVRSIIDTYQSHHKPSTNDLGHVSKIKNRLKKGELKEQFLTIEDLSNKLINGYAIIPAILQGGASDNNFVSQQVFMIDIDNKEKVLTIEDALKLCKNINPAFIYATFNYKSNLPKYRIVFVLDREITSKNDRDFIQKYLINLFNDFADSSCVDCSRVFYGGKKLLYNSFNSIVNSDVILKNYRQTSNKDFNSISDISLLDYILEQYPNSKIKRSGKTITINPCPLCGHNDDFMIYEDNTFCAFGEEDYINGKQIGGNIIDFICHSKRVRKSVARNLLNNNYNIINESSKKFKHNDFGSLLIDKYHIVKNDNCLYIFYNNCYQLERKDDSILEQIMIEEYDEITLHQRKEVYSYIERIAPHKDLAPSKYIAFKNCILNIETMEKMPYTADLLIRNIIPHNYVEYKEDNKEIEKIMLDFINGDVESKPILYEIIGYCLYNDNPFNSLFFIYGNGASGKTTYLNTLIQIVGKENCSYSIISDLGNKFGTSVLIGKLVNIGDDCKKAFIDDLATIKQITGDSTIEIEFKGKNKFNYKTYIKLIFSFNTLPKIGESGNQINRRIILIPFFNKFKVDPNNKVKRLLEDESTIEYLIYKGIIALNELLKRDSFTKSKLLEVEKKKYLDFLNPIDEFIQEDTTSFNNPNIYCEDTYFNYAKWCNEKGYEVESYNSFGRKIRGIYKPKQLPNGKRYYITK